MIGLDLLGATGGPLPVNNAQRAALDELAHKSLVEIQAETARTWAARAWAAHRLGLENDSNEYAHESLEHAALSGDDVLLAEVRAMIRGG